ncbi:MAG: TonB-dependent receptor domain-containing protein [Gemmatimonadaceae bacterium]
MRSIVSRRVPEALFLCSVSSPLTAQVTDTTAARDTAAVALPAVTISASIAPSAGREVGSGVPARISIVSRRELTAWQPRVLTDALRSVPGITLYDDIGSTRKVTFGLRGFNAGPTVGLPPGISVFLDGVRQNEPDAQEVNFDLLPMDNVERIEVLSGTASLLGPNSLGGAVNLITYRGDRADAGGEIEASRGSFGDRSLSANARGLSKNGVDYYASGAYDRENGWRDATGAESYDLFANFGRATDTHGIRLQLLGAKSRAETAGSLPESIFRISPRTNFTAGDFDDIKGLQVTLSGFQSTTHGSGSMNVYVRRSDAERFNANQPPDDNVRNFTNNSTVGGNVDWRWVTPLSRKAVASTLALRAGSDMAVNSVRVRLFSEPQQAVSSADTLTTNVESPSVDLAGYAIADLHVRSMTLSAGLRHDYVRIPFRNRLVAADNTTSSYAETNPRGGISMDLGGGASIYASAGRSFRAPAILELGCADPAATCPLPFALGEDPPLKPVTATTYETGATWSRGPLFFSGSAYRTSAHDEIFFVASKQALLSGFFTNIPETRRVGGELTAQLTGFGDRLHEYASVDAVRATFESNLTLFTIRADSAFASSPLAGPNNVVAGDRLPLTPDQIKSGALLRVGRANFGVDWRLVGRQWARGDESNETAPLPSYAITDVRFGSTYGAWKLSAVIENLFDDESASFATFNENRQTGELERFLTPLNGRTVRVTFAFGFGNRARD